MSLFFVLGENFNVDLKLCNSHTHLHEHSSKMESEEKMKVGKMCFFSEGGVKRNLGFSFKHSNVVKDSP